MKLILARHGHTNANKKKILNGHRQTRLTEEGVEQAKKLGYRLRKDNIDAIYSSDLTRAVHTAHAIMKYHPGLKLHKMKELRERDFGSAEYKKAANVEWGNVPDMETLSALRKRAIIAVRKIYQKHKGKNVVIVAHGGLNKAIMTYFLKKPIKHFSKLPSLDNTAVCIVKFSGKTHEVELFNCTKHLGKNKK